MGALSKQYKDMLLSLKVSDITSTLLVDLFSDRAVRTGDKVKIVNSKINTNDTFVLEANEYFNKIKITTNAGLFIINKLLFEEDLKDVTGYVNDPITKKVQEKIEAKISDALMNDIITPEQFAKYLNRLQWFSKQFNSMISTSFSPNTIKPVKSAIKLRDDMIKQNKDALAEGDLIAGVQIENAVKEEAKKHLKGDHGMNLYDSGARGSFDNNYKNMMLVKGPVADPTTGKYDFVGSNLMDGIKKEELPVYGTAIVNGTYPKSIKCLVATYGDICRKLS